MMETRQIALKLVLDQIGESTNIETVDDRLRMQKAIYIAQVFGINLGYQYSWYVKGPYSTDLTQDYYKLSAALSGGDTSYTQKILTAAFAAPAPQIRAFLNPPEGGIAKHAWYEALASLHFLCRISGYTVAKAKDYLTVVKPHLTPIMGRAEQHLRSWHLID